MLALTACGSESKQAEYQRKSIKVVSIYTSFKKDSATAEKKAESGLERFARGACRQTLGGGWSLRSIKNRGVLNCEKTPEGHHCRKKEVELECEQVVEFFPD